MPIGSSSVFARTMALMEHNRGRIRTVLDLGIGMGMNGAGVRQWLDFGVPDPATGRWRTMLVGVEGWAKYHTPLWEMYDVVHVERIEESRVWGDRWDVILMTDVIEHMPKPLGGYTLDRIAQALTPGGLAIVSTPAVYWPQGAAHGNDLERHVCLWTAADFAHHGWQVAWDGAPDEWGQRMLMATRGINA